MEIQTLFELVRLDKNLKTDGWSSMKNFIPTEIEAL